MRADALRGHIAIVTGASRLNGIGAATCREFAAHGADIFFTHWQRYDRALYQGTAATDPDTLLNELQSLGVRAGSMELDLSDPTAPGRLLDAAMAQLGPPTILVNNAAYSTRDGYERLDAATIDAHYAVNMRGTFLLSVEFAKRFRQGRGGRIINLTSGQSLGPMPGELAYAATKGAIEAFTRTLAREVAPLGITVNAVDPGPTDTGWMSDALKQDLLTKSPFGRLGQPKDAARLIAFLASADAAWITGQVIHSEGGFLHA